MTLQESIIKDDVPATEKILINALEKDPQNIDLWIKLCITELQAPFADYVKALHCIKKVNDIIYDHIDTLILEAGIRWHNFGYFEDPFFKRLCEAISYCRNCQDRAIIYYLQSLYYDYMEEKKQQKMALIRSVEQYDKFPYPLEDLGRILKSEGHVEDGKRMLQKAVECVKKVYYGNEYYDYTDLDTYIAEFITGTAISESNYNSIVKEVNT